MILARKKAICVVRNLESGWVTAYHTVKELYRDFMNRDLTIDYKDKFEGWYGMEFMEKCWRNKNKNIGFIFPKSDEVTAKKQYISICDNVRLGSKIIHGLDNYGIFSIDSRNKVVTIKQIDGTLWKIDN